MSIQEYSERWFAYPYPQISAVEGPISGMEYPMVAMENHSNDKYDLYDVVTHEIGHMWFPMIVGSNERMYMWQDEGFNTFINTFSEGRRYPEKGDQMQRAAEERALIEKAMSTPNVPLLEASGEAKDGRLLTTRERMEIHRKNATCNSCHRFMDPIGLSLDNFDVTGKWRYRENGMELDTRGQMYDGTPLTQPADLVRSLMKRPIPLVRAFTENMMAYALGRRVEDYDQPTVRAIAQNAESKDYRVSSIIMGVVNSSAFRSKRADPVVATQDTNIVAAITLFSGAVVLLAGLLSDVFYAALDPRVRVS